MGKVAGSLTNGEPIGSKSSRLTSSEFCSSVHLGRPQGSPLQQLISIPRTRQRRNSASFVIQRSFLAASPVIGQTRRSAPTTIRHVNCEHEFNPLFLLTLPRGMVESMTPSPFWGGMGWGFPHSTPQLSSPRRRGSILYSSLLSSLRCAWALSPDPHSPPFPQDNAMHLAGAL